MTEEGYLVGHLLYLDPGDPLFADRNTAEQHAVARGEEEPQGVWTPDGELLAIAYQGEMYYK